MIVGFIGLGDMGGHMAVNICRAGFSLLAYDLRPEALEPVVAAGGEAVGSVVEVGARADVVLVCVVTDEQVTDVVAGPKGLLTTARPGQTVVIHSTVRPGTVLSLASAASALGVDLLDIPVSGANMASKTGTLTLIAGGDAGVLERCRPVLDAVGQQLFHVGPVGAGQVAKIANNIMLHGNHALSLEAVKLAGHFGLDEAQFLQVVLASTGRSWVIENWDYLDTFTSVHTLAGTPEVYALMGKELWNATVVAKEQHVALPLTALAAMVTEGHLKEREQLKASRTHHTGKRER